MSKPDQKLTTLPTFANKTKRNYPDESNLPRIRFMAPKAESPPESSTSALNEFLYRNSINSLLMEYPIKTLVDSTQNFSEANCLGHGSFGKVYKGDHYGTIIAVKVLFSPKKKDFIQEVSALSKYRHPNLVMLMGYAMHRNTFYLIFEHISKGDLRERLTKGDLSWNERISILLDTATGLSYLHNSQPRCFHRDIKSSNILISESGSAKVADFGLARLASASQNFLKVKESAGTIGYADPHYVKTRTFSESSEVYSFGMLLLEVLTSRPPAERRPDGSIVFLISYINGELANILNILDTSAKYPMWVAFEVAKLALRCTDDNPYSRPNFLEIINCLRSLLTISSLNTGSAQSDESEYLEIVNNTEYIEQTCSSFEDNPNVSHSTDNSYNEQIFYVHANNTSSASSLHHGSVATFSDPENPIVNESVTTPNNYINIEHHISYEKPINSENHTSPENYINSENTISHKNHNNPENTICHENHIYSKNHIRHENRISSPPPVESGRGIISPEVTNHCDSQHISNPNSQSHHSPETTSYTTRYPIRSSDEYEDDEFDKILLDISLRISLEDDEIRRKREIEDQRELQAALEISKMEFESKPLYR